MMLEVLSVSLAVVVVLAGVMIAQLMRARSHLIECSREISELTKLVELLPVHIIRVAPDGEPIYFNRRLLEFCGLEGLSELDNPGSTRLATVLRSLVHPADVGLFKKTVRSLAEGESYSVRYRLRRGDGHYRWINARGEPIRDRSRDVVQWLIASVDVDDEVQALNALHERESQLRRLVDAVPANIWCSNPRGVPMGINQRLRDFVGTEIEDCDLPEGRRLDVAYQKLVHPDDLANVRERFSHCRRTGEPFAMRYRMRRADGVYRWFEGRSEPFRDESGEIRQWYGVLYDIEDQVKAEEALKERERVVWQLVETLPVMVDCAAPNGEPIFRGQQLREFLGYELEDLDGGEKSRLNGTLDAGVHPDDLAGVKEHYAISLRSGEPYARRHRLRRFDGEYRWVETRAKPMRNEDGEITQWNVICLDIDGEVKAEESLRLAQEALARASQAASLAELSASIAHEVNQPLSAVINSTNACLRWLQADPPNLFRATKSAERIIQSANSAADVVRRIRALFQQSLDVRDTTTLDGVLAEVRDFVAAEALRHNTALEINVEDDLQLMPFDRIQIQQVLMNLVRNGLDAMSTIPIERLLKIRVFRVGGEVHTEVSDRGAGVQFPERIFEPFFTTKEKGMGMGLAISRSIVEAHGGQLWAEKNGPIGSRFIFSLPAANAKSA
ncbi:PAS domain-containing protein [Sinorhizobium meliloti]